MEDGAKPWGGGWPKGVSGRVTGKLDDTITKEVLGENEREGKKESAPDRHGSTGGRGTGARGLKDQELAPGK